MSAPPSILTPAPLPHLPALLDALNCGALLLHRQGRIVHVNERLCRMTRRNRDDLVDVNVLSLYESDDAREFVQQTLAEFGRPRDAEFFLPLPDGTRLPVIASSRAVGAEAPLCDFEVITMIDISQQKAAEQAMREQYEIIAELSNTVLEQALALKHYAGELEERVRQRTAALYESNLDAVFMLAVAAEAKDDDTGRHVRRIQRYAQLLAEKLGLGLEASHDLGHAAILHDVGKIHVPDHILKKPGALTPDERLTMQQHTVVGQRILSTKPFFEGARRIARSHHENWDGSGYPDALGGQNIPVEARIVRLADVFDALTTPRVYKPAWPDADAARAITEGSGQCFDPEVVSAFTDLFSSGAFTTIRLELDAPAS